MSPPRVRSLTPLTGQVSGIGGSQVGVVLGREGGTWHWVRPQEGHVLTARQRDHTSPRLDGVAAPPHSWTEWPHVLTAGRSGLMSSPLDGVTKRPHSWTEWPHVLMAGRSGLAALLGAPGDRGSGGRERAQCSDVAGDPAVVLQGLWPGGMTHFSLGGTVVPRGFGGPPWRRKFTP